MGSGDELYLDRIRAHHIPTVNFPTPEKKIDFAAIRAIRQELKTGRYDIVQAFQGKAIAAMLIAATGIQVKTVAYRGQTGNIYRHDPVSYLTMLHPRLDGITCVAKAIERDLGRRLWRKHRPRLTTIYKGHDVNWYQRCPVSLQDRLGIPPDAFVIGFAANVRPRKGLGVLLEAFNSLPTDSKIHLLLMGRGTELIQPAGRLHCLGYRQDVIELLSSCHATVLPTLKREGLSRSIIESMALEIPVIASDTGGNAELVADGQTGLVVPPGDAAALASAMLKLSQDRQHTQILGKQARERIAQQFNHRTAVKQYQAFYLSLLEHRACT